LAVVALLLAVRLRRVLWKGDPVPVPVFASGPVS
jgi:hypothetical protein